MLFFTAATAEEQKTREIYVPFSDLHVLLQNQPKRVLIGRQEFEELRKKAERAPKAEVPVPALLTAADYSIKADRQRAEIAGKLTVDVLGEGLHALPLDLAGVGLRAARLDDRPASIGLDSKGRPVLFVEGVGLHRLELEMTAPLETTAARQVLSYRLPRPPAATLRLEVPGDVEIKGGAEVVSRDVDAQAKVTRFELLPKHGDVSVLMTLNSHLLRVERAVIARGVAVDTVSEAYEQLETSVTMSILHRAVDRFRFVVPNGFEITDVKTPLLSRWDVVKEDGRRVLEARLNEPTTETTELGITAVRAPAKLADWTAPRLVPLDVIGDVSVFGLKVGSRLRAESLSAEGLIPLDTSVFGDAKDFLAAYYAPSGDYALSARFLRPPSEMAAATSLLMSVSDEGLELRGSVSLSPKMEKRFSFDLFVPAGWRVSGVATADGRPLPFEFYEITDSPHTEGSLKSGATAGLSSSAGTDVKHPENTAGQASSGTPSVANGLHPNPLPKGEGTKNDGALPKGEGTGRAGRVRVSVPRGMKVGEVFSARFLAISTPKGWLDDWRKTTVVFPEFNVLDATESDGAVAVESRDDIIVLPGKLEHLTPLGADERARFGLKTESVSLAFLRQEVDFTAVLSAERTEPRLTARSISFFRVDRDALQCHYEVNYAIEQSRVQKLLLSLPEDTPDALKIVGLDGVKLKEYTGKLVEGRRRWTVLLAEPRRGRVRLAVDFQQRLPEAEAKDHALPIVEAEDVSYQSGLAAVEGCAELEVNVKEPPEKSLRRVDVGELAEADYQPGRRLLGAYEYVGAPPSVKIGVTRRPGYDIPPAIVEKCELDTVLSPEGLSRHQAVFHIRSKVSFLRVELPNRAKLWAAELNGSPLKPQRDANGLLIDLSVAKDGAAKRLKLIYADDKSRPISVRGTLYVPAPKLFLHDSAGSSRVGQAQRGPTDESGKHGEAALRSTHPTSSDNRSYEVPTADMVWRLHLPSGYEVVSADGTLSTADVSRPEPAAFKLAGFLYKLSNGFRDSLYLCAPMQETLQSPYYMEDSGVCYDRQLAESSPCSHSDAKIPYIGRVTGMKDCQWANPQAAGYIGASTPLGRKYSLSSGLMELTMNDGARIVLEGACTFTPDSPDGGYLALGKITIKNSNAAGEYSLRTPTAVVTVDPQAEVGVEVSRGGVTLARTFSGRVRMLSSDNGKEYVMDGHGAATVVRGDPRSPTPAQSPEPRAFSRSLAEKPKSIELTDIVAGGGGQNTYEPINLSASGASVKKIESALKSPTQIEFIETPLQDIIDYLKDFHKIEIQIDNRALADVGIGADTPITKNLKGISLRSALRLMLREQGLTYMIQDEVLLITTPEEAETRLTTVVYPVSDLVEFRNKSGEVWTDFDSLIDTITSTAKPTTWDEVGGSGTIAPQTVGGKHVLVFSQTQEVHREVEKLLDNLRKVARGKSPDGRLPIREKPTYSGGAMGGMAGGMGGMGGMAGEGTFGPREGKPDTGKEGVAGVPLQPAPPAATVPKPPPPVYAHDGKGENKRGESVGMSQPGVLNEGMDGEEEEAEKQLGESRSLSDMQKESTKYGSPILNRLPYNNGTSIEYPDVEANEELAGKHDEKHKEAYFALGKLTSSTSLSGMRSLKIDLLQTLGDTGQTVTFQGLGVKPRLAVTLADDARFHKLRFGLALAVALIGLAITRRNSRVKTEYVLGVMLATTLGALFGGLEIAHACNWMFFAAAALVPYYLLAGFCRWACRLCWRACLAIAASFTPKKIGATSVLIGVILTASVLYAGENAKPQAPDGPYFIQVEKPSPPIDLPKDAIILPYDPEWKNGIRDADKLLVPYDKYVELWNRAYPDKKIETKAPPADFALAGATYSTTLEGDDSLSFAGRIQIDVFTDRYVQVPLGLAGGVLTRAELDGKPARLSVLMTPQPQVKSKAQKPFAVSRKSPERSVVILHVTGKGRHTLELDARMKLQRHGGWRAVQGELPTAPAAALDIVVPRPKTELRLDAVADCRRYETEKPDQTIPTALGENGAVRLRWRPEVASGRIDRALTASSQAVFDIREDGLGIDWLLTLEFRNAERDRFDVELPEGYLLEKVEGDNVRGWRLRTINGRPSVEIELLQTAKDREQFSLRLWRAGRIGRGAEPVRFDVPMVTVSDAALQSGRLTVRRSPLLELQTIERKGATRIDLPAGKKSSSVAAGPLGIRPFESYSFAAVPFTVRLSAVELEAKTSAMVESVLKLAEYKQLFESRVTFDVRGRPLHRLRVLLPEDYELTTIDLQCRFYHTVTKQGERPLLTVYPASGLDGETPLLIVGSLKRRLAEGPREMPLPRIEALDVGRQSGDMAVQTDPSFDVELLDPAGCESVLPGRLYGWLNPKQRKLTRLALHMSEGGYSGKLRLTPRKPDVSCNTITNMRITARTVEETILLNYHVARAGVRRFAFILPESMADSRIGAPLMQRKTVTPAGDRFPGMVRVEIELQEEATDDVRVLVENDRLLGVGEQEAPVPIVVGDVRVVRRYLVLENAGRGELVVDQDKLHGMDPLGSRRKEWAELKSLLGGGITMAYMASPDAKRPALSFRVKLHDEVKTVKASIGLAETKLVLDAAGAYRAEVVLKVNNETEQYLDVQLPRGALLWTTRVAGEPVKPTLTDEGEKRTAGGRSDTVRIPLLKTAQGDLDYEVILRYGGRMPAPSRLGSADFPMIRCLNITPALCQATLYLPDRYHWFDFGGTMRRVVGESELDVGRIQYQNKQLKQIGLALEKGDKWAKSRAAFNIKRQSANNLKQIGLAVHNYQQSLSMKGTLEVAELQAEISKNASLMEQTQKKLEEQQKSVVSKPNFDNRQKMNDAFAQQKINPSKNVAIESGSNWDGQNLSRNAAIGRQTQSLTMAVTPRIAIQEEEEERLGVQPPAIYDPFASDAPSSGVARDQGRQTLGRNYTRQRFGPTVRRPGGEMGVIQPEATLPANDARLPDSTDLNGTRGQQTQQAQEAESLNRYQQRLAKQSQTGGQYSLQGNRAGSAGDAGRVPSPEPSDAPVQLPTYARVTVPAPGVNVEQASPRAAGLASLDFTLPTRGRAYRFTTPRGEQQITARYVSDDIARLAKEAAIVGFAIVMILLIVGMTRRGRLGWLVRPAGTWLMLAVGLVSLFSGFLPVASIALIAVACVLKFRWLARATAIKRTAISGG